jgi:tetratricopeptide (TPR) repeat protein
VKKFFVAFGLLFISFLAFAQQSKLANQYYANGEYEKAASLFQQLYEKENTNEYYFQKLTECMITLKQYDAVRDIIQKEIKRKPEDATLIVALGNLHERMSQPELAKKQYSNTISKIDKNPQTIDKLARAFIGYSLFDEAITTYEKGIELTKDKKSYAFTLADLYKRVGQPKKMIYQYLLSVEQFKTNMDYLKQTFEKNLNDDEIKELQSQIFVVMQEEPDQVLYPELLEWTYIQQKDYKKALRQSKSIDRKLEGNGEKVFNMGNVAYNDEDYDAAIDGYAYITETYSINSPYYLSAKRALLNSKKNKITKSFKYTKEDLMSLDLEYKTFLETYGRNSQTALLMIEYADFLALYLNDLNGAKALLKEMVEFGGVQPNDNATGKLKLGDYYLMDGDRWEASLLYSQVDKAFKEAVLGEDARYKNAKLSYYTGDFEWAQQQFEILKSATSRLISNDAIDMNVFIMDNLNLDTTDVTLGMFASAELLVFQNKFEEAFLKLDSVQTLFPEHSLVDDMLYTKAQIYKKINQPEKAIALYNIIIEKYPEEIRCDNAIYELAKMYDYQLNEPLKAQDLYFKLFTEFTGSTFAVDARKRYRILRGDDMDKS